MRIRFQSNITFTLSYESEPLFLEDIELGLLRRAEVSASRLSQKQESAGLAVRAWNQSGLLGGFLPSSVILGQLPNRSGLCLFANWM